MISSIEYLKNNPLRVYEAFSGYGSQELELQELGIWHTSVGISEVDIWAIIAYGALRYQDQPFDFPEVEVMRAKLMQCGVGWDFKKNKSKIPRLKKETLYKLYKYHVLSRNQGDISKISADTVPPHDLFTYSFPCQDISTAGLRQGLERGSGTRSSLLWECERLIEHNKPSFLMMENVKNLVGKKHISDFDKWVSTLSNLGYNSYRKVINGTDCGIPQNRERVFVMSIRKDIDDGNFKFNEAYDSGLRLNDMLDENVPNNYYLTDLQYNKIVNSKFNQERERIQGDICSTLLARDYKDPKCVKVPPKLIQDGNINIKDNESIKRVYNPIGVCPTITTMEGGHRQPKIIESTSDVRKLTELECLRLMGLSEKEIQTLRNEDISKSQLYKLAGNSIIKSCMAFFANLPLIQFMSGNMGNKL